MSSSSDVKATEEALSGAVLEYFKTDDGKAMISTAVAMFLKSKKGQALISKIVTNHLNSKPAAIVTTTPRKARSAKSPTPGSASSVKTALARAAKRPTP